MAVARVAAQRYARIMRLCYLFALVISIMATSILVPSNVRAEEPVLFDFNLGGGADRIEFVLPDQCHDFTAQSEFISQKIYTTSDINEYFCADL